MGCASSQQRQLPPTAGEEWKKYDELERAIFFADPLKGPSEEHINTVKSCTLSALEPANETDPPLLVVARNHDEWFRLLIQKCDPTVTWKEGGKERTLGSMLHGEKFTLWCKRKEEWERERQQDEMETSSVYSAWSNDRWWSEFGLLLPALGLGVAAGAGIVLGSAAAAAGMGFPLAAVGPFVWQAIKKWQASLSRCAPSPDLTPLFSFHTKEVGSTLQELNDRLQVAKVAAANAPGDAQANQEYERQRKHVGLLQVLLEDQTEKVNTIAGRKISDKAKKDEMVKMLQELLKFQRGLNAELMQEHVSDLLERSEARLASIENLLSLTLASRAKPVFSRSQSLALDAGTPDCPVHVPRNNNRAASEHGRRRDNLSFFYDVCPSCSEQSHASEMEEESKSASPPRHS